MARGGRCPGRRALHGPVLNRASMVIDAAIDGQGIALARTTLAATDLINGRLVRPFAEELRLSKTYWIICPKATATLPKIMTFRDWLLAEAASDMRQLKKLGAGVVVPPCARRLDVHRVCQREAPSTLICSRSFGLSCCSATTVRLMMIAG